MEGYTQALAEAGILLDRSLVHMEEQFDLSNDEGSVPEAHVTRFAAFLTEHPAITAIFATNAALALVALHAAARLGRRIPEDLSIVNIDPLTTVPLNPPRFTCGRQQGYEMGTTAVKLVLEQLAGQQPRRVVLPMRLQHEGTIAPPRNVPN